MMEAVDGPLGLAKPAGDLQGRETDQMAQDQNLSLLVWQAPESVAQ